MLVQKVDVVGAQPFERPFHRTPYVVGAAIEGRGLPFFYPETELGAYFYLVAERFYGFAHPFLAGVRPVNLGRVEECHAAVVCPADKGNHVLLFVFSAVVTHHRQAAKAYCRYVQRAEAAVFRPAGGLVVFAVHFCRCSGGCGCVSGQPGHCAYGRNSRKRCCFQEKSPVHGMFFIEMF